MGLEGILQKGKNRIRRTLSAGLTFSTFLACTEPTAPYEPPEQPPQNKAPQTEITHVFGEEGFVSYTFSGTDNDGSVSHIVVRINGGAFQNLPSGSSRLSEIIKGTNSVIATAYDNKGLADPTPAGYSFVSPTEDQAIPIISGVLNARASSYNRFERGVFLSLGADKGFYVDFLITKKNNTNAVIHYVGHERSLSQESDNQEFLNVFGIPNLYLFRLPESEIKSRLNLFIDRGFN